MTKEPLCLYHDHCADGFTAAWVVSKYFGHSGAELVGVSYGDQVALSKVAGRAVIIVDFSFPKEVLLQMSQVASIVIVLDHHKTAAEALAGLPEITHVGMVAKALRGEKSDAGKLYVQFDMGRSGATMAWDFFFPNKITETPPLVQYVEDRDLWRHDLNHTKEVNAFIAANAKLIPGWTQLDEYLREDLSSAVEIGSWLLIKDQQHIEAILDQTTREMKIGGYVMEVANCPGQFASEVAGALATDAYHGVAASYFDGPHGRKFSLRRRGDSEIDVSAIAKRFGGGGHAAAAGFTRPIGWEGEP